VVLQRGDQSTPMEQAGGGWWALSDPCPAGMDYAYSLDGSPPLPDPRSPWQPTSVHGASRTVDHAAFVWSDDGWQPPTLAEAIIYELHVGTFTEAGTFASAVEKLDHLVSLGVTHVELMPVNEFSGDRGWGYDGVDLFAPHHAYGGPEGLKTLVDACHARSLAVLLDVVYNHLGPAGNYLAQFGPYFADRYRTPWGKPPNLDGPQSDEVRRFFCDNALMWLRDYHFDGLRIDAVHALFDQSATHFLEQLAVEVAELGAELGRPLALIAESDLNDPRVVRERQAGGYGLAAQWSDDFHHALHTVLTGEQVGIYGDFGQLADLAKALASTFVYDGRYSRFRQRSHGRPVGDLPASRFVVCLQNHDQVGNRPTGDRTSKLLRLGQLKIGAALVFTAPFVPMLFQGEEWGASTPFLFFTGHEDAQLARKVKEGRSHEFSAWAMDPDQVPDPNDPATFARSKLNWAELEQGPHRELLDWHRQLIQLRKSETGLAMSDMASVDVDFDEEGRWLVLRREAIVVACNFAATGQALSVPTGPARVLLATGSTTLTPGACDLPGESVAILRLES
jgi:maltooligosyltrehalose trehalohydrolase